MQKGRARVVTEPATPLDPDFLGEYVLYLMAQASHAMSAEFHAIVRENGLRVPHWRILATLASHEPRSVTELGASTLYDQPRLTKTLDGMVRDGLIDRGRDPRDRRVAVVTLTEAGRARVRGLLALAREHEARALERLTATERRRLKAILRKLVVT